MTRTLLLALGASLLATAAASADPVDTSLCSNEPAGAAPAFGLAKVIGTAKAPMRFCAPGAADCHELPKTPYVIPGDTVIVGAKSGTAICAVMPNRVGDSEGWIAASQLAPLPTPPAPPAAWAGHWLTAGGGTVDLKPNGAQLRVSGSACWPACDTPPSKLPYGPNVGELDDAAAPVAGRLTIGTPDDCMAELWLVGEYLLVFDNRSCGGMNVSFTGVYQRRARR